MTNEERDLISQFVARVGGNAGGGFSRGVPSTQPALAPIDPEADRFIADQFASHPEARYRITQMAVVQEAALAEAASRMQRMQAELEAARQQMQQMQQSAPPQQQSRGFLGGLFGSGQASAPPPQQQSPWNQGQGAQPQYAPQASYAPPQYPPNVQPGMFQRSGSGFLGSALGTAAGVAGGVVAGNLLMDMFSGHGGGMGAGGFGGGGGFGGMAVPNETTIVNNYGDAGAGGYGAGGAGGVGPADWDNSTQSGASDPGWSDSSQGSSWDDSSQDSGGGGGGFDDNSL